MQLDIVVESPNNGKFSDSFTDRSSLRAAKTTESEGLGTRPPDL